MLQTASWRISGVRIRTEVQVNINQSILIFPFGLVVVCVAEKGRATWHNPGPAQKGACGIVYNPNWNGGNWVAMVSQ